MIISNFLIKLIGLFLLLPCVSGNQECLKHANESLDYPDQSVIDYYHQNHIYPTNNPGPTEPLKATEIPDYLATNYGGSGWYQSSLSSFSVDDATGVLPIEVNEWDSVVQSAKQNANITSQYIGCGRLALLNQLDYINRAFGYYELGDNEVGSNYFLDLSTSVFEYTPGIPADLISPAIPGLTGTYVFPSAFINSSREVCENMNMAQKRYYDSINYEWLLPFDVNGDSYINNSTYQTKFNLVKSSIDSGMPVVWWTSPDAQSPYHNHYMNVYGYEKSVSASSGGAVSHYVFKLRMNWNLNYVAYVDANILFSNFGGFVTFLQAANTHSKVGFSSMSLPNSFVNQEFSIINAGSHIDECYGRRSGLINFYLPTDNSQHSGLLMSGRNGTYTQAYVGLCFDLEVANITFYLSKWPSDTFDSSDYLSLGVYGTGYSNSFDISLSSLSADYYSPTKMTFSFVPRDYSIQEFCLQLQSTQGSSGDSKRLIVSGMSILFERNL